MHTEETVVRPVFAHPSLSMSTSFGYRLASLRTQRRISSWDLAACLQIPLLQLDRMERGDEDVEPEMLPLLARVFRMPVSRLLLGL
jgi:transcriptional regulator with XRE-family HTH domain